MKLTKNKLYQFLFFFIFMVYCIFNGGNSNLSIQFNFILVGILFIFCIRDKNYYSHFKAFYNRNKIFLNAYFLFLTFVLAQTIPVPIELLKIISYQKYKLLEFIYYERHFSSVSLSPSDTFFQFLNYLSLIIFLFITKMVFYRSLDLKRFYFFLSLIGSILSIFAVVLYLFGNPDVLFIKKIYHYRDSSTGFFINRTVFSIFLLFCLIASLEIQKYVSLDNNIRNNDNFFLKIYTRFFIIFITLGIITSFSRTGNFLMLITIIFYLIGEFYNKKNINIQFRLLLFAIIIFDILILGLFFGSSKLIDRFSFINNEFSNVLVDSSGLSRFQIIRFSFSQISNFVFFGYGAGSFETLFKIFFPNDTSFFADHAHSSILEFFGEFGLIGTFFLIFSLSKIFFKNIKFNNIILLIYFIVLLSIDFSLHVPIIQLLFVIFFTLNNKFTP